MSWSPITSGEIQVGKPGKQELWQKIKDSLDYLFGQISTQSGSAGVPNGSFEIDSDSSGIPDSWTRNLYAGGAGAYDTATPAHGAKAYKFTHPGGAGNGGGYLVSDYIEINSMISPIVEFSLKCSAAGMKNHVYVDFYTAAKAYISSEYLYTSTSNPTSWKRYLKYCIPPANACWMKITLIAGYTDTNVAGDIYWDDIKVNASPNVIPVDFTLAEQSRGSATWADVGSVTFKVPKGFDVLFFPARIRGETTGATNGQYVKGRIKFRFGSTYSNVVTVDGPRQAADNLIYAHNDASFELSVSGIDGSQTLYMQLICDGIYSTVYGQKDPEFAQFVRF